MRRATFCFVLSVLALAEQVMAADHRQDPCFQGTHEFFRNFQALPYPDNDFPQVLEAACSELEDPRFYEPKSAIEAGADAVRDGIIGTKAKVGTILSLGAQPGDRKLQAKIAEIKKIEDPYERIRRSFHLAADTQGQYDYENAQSAFGKFKRLFTQGSSPLATTQRVSGGAPGGVCSDFSILFAWILSEVSKAPSNTGSKLDAHDFVAEVVYGKVPATREKKVPGDHAWVRVHMPVYVDGVLQRFQSVDLDTTFYPKQFALLPPRRIPMSEQDRTERGRQCRRIQSCLRERYSERQKLLDLTPRPSGSVAPAKK